MNDRLGWLLASVFVLGGCSEDTPGPGPAPDAAAVDGGGGVPEGGNLCPDPKNPRVHYVDADPNKCIGVTLMCTTEQNGFQGRCGCGCIDKGDPLCPEVDNPTVVWTSQDPTKCGDKAPPCPKGQVGFTGACGCGCITPGGG